MRVVSDGLFEVWTTLITMDEFVSARRLAGGHRMTIYTWARRRTFTHLPAPRPRYFDVASDARVLAHCHWQPIPRQRPTLVALHGLEGSSQAHYMRGLADKGVCTRVQRRLAEPGATAAAPSTFPTASTTPASRQIRLPSSGN